MTCICLRLSRVNKRLASVYSLIEHLDASTLTQKEIREKVNGFKILASTIKKLKKLSSLHIPVLKWPYGGEEEPLASVLFQLSKLTYLRLECRPAPVCFDFVHHFIYDTLYSCLFNSI